MADRSHIKDTGVFYFDNISAEDMELFLLKQSFKSLLILPGRILFCLAGSAQQAQHLTHLVEGKEKKEEEEKLRKQQKAPHIN